MQVEQLHDFVRKTAQRPRLEESRPCEATTNFETGHSSRMRENVVGFPTLQVQLGSRWKKFETGMYEFDAALACEHFVEAFAERM